MFKKLCLFIVLMVGASLTTFGSEVLNGSVLDYNSGDPVEGILVTVTYEFCSQSSNCQDIALTQYTDAGGGYSFTVPNYTYFCMTPSGGGYSYFLYDRFPGLTTVCNTSGSGGGTAYYAPFYGYY